MVPCWLAHLLASLLVHARHMGAGLAQTVPEGTFEVPTAPHAEALLISLQARRGPRTAAFDGFLI